MKFLERLFFHVGRGVGSHPKLFIAVSVVFIGCLSAGLTHLKVVQNPQAIWVPPGSPTAKQQSYFGNAFDPFFRIEQAIFMKKCSEGTAKCKPSPGAVQQAVSINANGYAAALQGNASKNCQDGNLVTIQAFKEMLRVQEAIETTADSAGLSRVQICFGLQHTSMSAGTTLDDICYKPVLGEGCIIESPLNYVKSNSTLLDSMDELHLQEAMQCAAAKVIWPGFTVTKPCWSNIGVPIMKDVVLGDQRCCDVVDGVNKTLSLCGKCNTVAGAGFITFLIKDDPITQKRAELWEKEVFLKLLGSFQSSDLSVSYMAQRSIQDELEVVSSQNTFVVIVSYVAMFIYISLAMGKFPDPVHSRVLLGLQGICIVGGSVLCSLGVCSWAGLSITMIVEEVVPFLILAIGVDNMFIVSKAFERRRRPQLEAAVGGAKHHSAQEPESVQDTMAHTLADVGPTIVAAATGEIFAFVVGVSTNIPALVQFCVVAAVAVFFDVLLQLSWFCAAVVIDAKRAEANRYDLLPCCVRQSPPSGPAVLHEDASQPTCKQRFWSLVMKGEYVKHVLESYYAPVLSYPAVKALVLVVWAGCLAASIIGASHLQLGLPQQLVLPTGSYLENYFNQQAQFGDAGPPAYIVLQNVDYSNAETGPALTRLQQQLAAATKVINGPVYSWMAALDAYNTLAPWKSALGLDAVQGMRGDSSCYTPFPDAPIAVQAYRFVTELPIDSACCQSKGQCGAQYTSDVSFFWAPLAEWKRQFPNASSTLLEYLGRVANSTREAVAPDGSKALVSNQGMVPLHIMSSRLRTQHVALRDQSTFISAMQGIYAAVSRLAPSVPSLTDAQLRSMLPAGTDLHSTVRGIPGAFSDNQHTPATGWLAKAPTEAGPAFPYSLTYVYYEQYNIIRGVAIENFLLALGAVFASVMILASPSAALFTTVMVACITLDIVGLMWVWNPPVAETKGSLGADMKFGVDINAVSVVNLVMAVGLSVEFCVHICTAFLKATGSKEQRSQQAVSSMGSNVVTGITLTKFVGVLVLAWAPSKLFRLYYFRMYFSIIILGAFHGLMVLPVVLSLVGPASSSAHAARAQLKLAT